jgi:hypothetical protein
MEERTLTVAELLLNAELIERSLTAFESTAPRTVTSLGGRQGLVNLSEMTCVGPIPRLDAAAWERMSREYELGRDERFTMAYGARGLRQI